MACLASVEYAQCRIGSAHGLCSQSQGGSDTVDHFAGASVEHLTATNFVAGRKTKPGTKGFGATPFAHVDAGGSQDRHSSGALKARWRARAPLHHRRRPDGKFLSLNRWRKPSGVLSRNWRHKSLNTNKLYEIATLPPFSGFSTKRQFFAQVTEP